jgi:hypothetical protein
MTRLFVGLLLKDNAKTISPICFVREDQSKDNNSVNIFFNFSGTIASAETNEYII